MVPLSKVLVPLGDWNGHVGASADGYEESMEASAIGSARMRVNDFLILLSLYSGFANRKTMIYIGS